MAGDGTADRAREVLGLPVRHGVPSPPRVELRLPGAVPGSVVRIAGAAALLALAALSAPPPALGALAVAAAGTALWRPTWPVAPIVLVVVGFVVLAGPDLLAARPGGGDGLLRASALALCAHLAVRLGALAGRVAWRGVVDRAVLGVVGRSVLAGQVLVQGALLAVVWLRSGVGAGPAGQEWLRLVAAAAVAAVALLAVPRGWLSGPRRARRD